MNDILSEKMLARLVARGILTAEKLDRARKERPPERMLTEHLLDRQIIDAQAYLEFMSEYYKYPILNPETFVISPDVLAYIPGEFVERYQALPVSCLNGTLTVAMANPENVLMLDDLKSLTGKNIVPVISLPRNIRDAIQRYYKDQQKEDTSIQDLIKEVEVQAQDEQSSSDLLRMAAETPIIKITNALLTEAIRRKASDLFVEPWEKKMRVRCRVDGLLEEMKAPPRSMAEAIVSRVKIMSELNIAERRLPQDGRFRIKALNRMIDIRVSIIPTAHGEKACLRILDKGTHRQELDKLGFHSTELERIRYCAEKPYGMILVTGPTGSGKSTTLYSILEFLHDDAKNITTVEDPVEYKVDGINQVQVHENVGLTFPAALRSILRQDPDIIMLGEIRDHETLDIAMKAALTGHLVLSTLHTNDAASSVVRMTNMGLEPFLITASVLMVSAQRLVRKICQNCREAYVPSKKILTDLKLAPDREYHFYKPSACTLCRRTGYSGRMVITEVMLLTPELNRMVIAKEAADAIKERARQEGMNTLRESGVRKVVTGETTLEEVFRVTMPDPETGRLLEI